MDSIYNQLSSCTGVGDFLLIDVEVFIKYFDSIFLACFDSIIEYKSVLNCITEIEGVSNVYSLVYQLTIEPNRFYSNAIVVKFEGDKSQIKLEIDKELQPDYIMPLIEWGFEQEFIYILKKDIKIYANISELNDMGFYILYWD